MSRELTVQLPEMPPDLAHQVETYFTPPTKWPGLVEDDPGFVLSGLSATSEGVSYHPQAKHFLEQLEAISKPPKPEVIADWVSFLATGVASPPGPEEIRLKTGALMLNCGNLPAVWTRETLIAALDKFKFFPSAAEVKELLSGFAEKIQRQKQALEAMANAPWRRPTTIVPGKYEIPPAPEWCGDRTTRHFSGKGVITAQPPIRSVEQQLAILRKDMPANDQKPTIQAVLKKEEAT